MKKTVILVLTVFLFSSAYAADFTGRREKLVIAEPEKSLRVGERLEYNLEWLGLAVGKIILQVTGVEKISGRDCYHVLARAMPNKFFIHFYDIEYTVHTYIDTQTLQVLRFEKIRRYKKKSAHVLVDFDHVKKEAKFSAQGPGDTIEMSPERGKMKPYIPRPSVKISDGVQDLFSSLYYFRLQHLEENKTYTINIYYDRRSWPEEVKIGVPFSREVHKKGVFTVFKATMTSSLNKYILGNPEFTVYFNADSRRIPLEFNLGTGLGFIRGKLHSTSD